MHNIILCIKSNYIMGLLLKIFIAIAIISFLYSCFGKKKTTDGLEAWLDIHYKGRLKILNTSTSDPIKHLSFKVKNSVVASTDDSLHQIVIRWDKRVDDLGISLDEVNDMLTRSKVELTDARELFNLIKEGGLSSISCAITNAYARILLFKEPTPENRIQILEKLIVILQTWLKTKNYGLAIDIMEPKAIGSEFGDIIPLPHWQRADSWQTRNTLLTLRIDPGTILEAKSMNQQWKFNTESDRLVQWIETSRPLATEWAKDHLKKAHRMLSQTQYSALENQLGAQIQFPISYSTNSDDSSNIDGYITGNYLLDEGKIGPFKLTKE